MCINPRHFKSLTCTELNNNYSNFANTMRACIEGSSLSTELKEAILSKLENQENVVVEHADLSHWQRTMLRMNKPAVFPEEFFVVKQTTMVSLKKKKKATCAVWVPNERTERLQQQSLPLPQALDKYLDVPYAIYDICGLDWQNLDMAKHLLQDCDIFDESSVLSVGETYTRYHVEDHALENFQTLQRVHKNSGEAFKIWFFSIDPDRGQSLRRAQDHMVSERLVHDADYVIVQLEGQTMFIPPLVYHAVVTAYAAHVPAEKQYTLMSGTLFADIREGSLYLERLRIWVQKHQTGHRHGLNVAALPIGYDELLNMRRGTETSETVTKKQKRKKKASLASLARWKK